MNSLTPDTTDQFATFDDAYTSSYRFEPTPPPMKAVSRTQNDLADYVYTHNGTLDSVKVDRPDESIWESKMVGIIMKVVAALMAFALLALSAATALGAI